LFKHSQRNASDRCGEVDLVNFSSALSPPRCVPRRRMPRLEFEPHLKLRLRRSRCFLIRATEPAEGRRKTLSAPRLFPFLPRQSVSLSTPTSARRQNRQLNSPQSSSSAALDSQNPLDGPLTSHSSPPRNVRRHPRPLLGPTDPLHALGHAREARDLLVLRARRRRSRVVCRHPSAAEMGWR
jgi:hypothetical protein